MADIMDVSFWTVHTPRNDAPGYERCHSFVTEEQAKAWCTDNAPNARIVRMVFVRNCDGIICAAPWIPGKAATFVL